MGFVHLFSYASQKYTVQPPPNEFVLWIDREKHGRCATCGLQTHEVKQGLFYVGSVLVPLTNDTVMRGRCLACKPLETAVIEDADSPSPVLDNNIRISIPGPVAEDLESTGWTFKSKMTLAGIVFAIIAAAVSITVPIVFTEHNKKDDISTNATMTKVASKTTVETTSNASSISMPALSYKDQVSHELEANTLSRGVKFDELAYADSRNMALDWLVDKDPLNTPSSDTNLSQRYVLALLAFEFGELFRSQVNWLSHQSECKWDWVTCNSEGEVTELNLAKENITGTIPPEIGILQSLEKVSVAENSLYGTLPSEIGSLQSLQALQIWSNQLTGTIPDTFSDLNSLLQFQVSHNKLSGDIPSWMGGLKSLEELNLHDNQFTGILSGELKELSSLNTFTVSWNQLSGTVPSWFGELDQLSVLWLNNNLFTGVFPNQINEHDLKDLCIRGNMFTGDLPVDIETDYICPDSEETTTTRTPTDTSNDLLIQQDLQDNALSRGAKFEELSSSNSRNLALDWILNDDQFSANDPRLHERFILALMAFDFGTLFRSSWNWLSTNDICSWEGVVCNENLEVSMLTLQEKNLTGTIPPEISGLRSLQHLSIWRNSLFGTLPAELGYLAELQILWLNENKFVGTLPSELGGLQSLTSLNVRTNQLVGSIPSEFQQLTSLKVFSVCWNLLTGTIPSWIGELKNLEELYLQMNQFTGTICPELKNLTSLIGLGLSANQLTGSVPSWIGDFNQLKILWLNDNKFTGTFPREIEENLVLLEDFCINGNMFIGELPAEIETMNDCVSGEELQS